MCVRNNRVGGGCNTTLTDYGKLSSCWADKTSRSAVPLTARITPTSGRLRILRNTKFFVTVTKENVIWNNFIICIFHFGGGGRRNSHQWGRASSFMRFLDCTQRRTTVGRTPLDAWSALRRDLYLTTHNTNNKHPCTRWNSNPQSQRASGRRRLIPRGHWDRLSPYLSDEINDSSRSSHARI